MRLVSIFLASWLGACGSGPAKDPPVEFGGDRPVDIKKPTNFDASKTYPLVLVLHGYGVSGFIQAAVFETNQLAADAFVLAPDGTVDSMGKQFWNADEACCDFDMTHVDDVAYLGGLLDDVRAAWPISDVFIEGHSNGGFMAYRMACERADAISAIVSLAGDAATTPANCQPSQPVSVLHLHGTVDDMVPFEGADRSVSQWITHDGCGSTRTTGTPIDLDVNEPGAETTRSSADGCPSGIGVELWAIQGAGHVPSFGPLVGTTLFQWFTAHARG